MVNPGDTPSDPTLRNENLAGLLAGRAAKAGWNDRAAFHAPHVVTHGQIHERAARLGEVLKRRGLAKGDRILLCLPDSVELVQVLLACLGRGILAFLVNPELHPEEHAFAERDTEPTLVITSSALRDRFQRTAVSEAKDLVSDATRVNCADYEVLTGDTPAYATYTSGTTGAPKAAIHRHADVWSFIEAMCATALRLSSSDIGLSMARMYFAYGLGNSVWFPLATGGSAVISSSPLTAEAAAALSARFKPSVLYGAPTFFARVIDGCSPDAFRSLRCVVSAGEALEAGLAARLGEFFGGIPILDGLGSSEVGQTFVSNRVDEWRLGTLGKVLPPYGIRVVAADGTTADPDVEGDLWVQGPSITTGYWNRPIDSLQTNGSWLNTGDRVSIDADGWVTYHCRADEVEIVGGINVNPREVERLILEHDSVAEAAVVAVRESTGASALQAFLVPKSDGSLNDSVIRDIYGRLRMHLSSHNVPDRFAILGQLPRTATGKLVRAALRVESPTKPIWKEAAAAPSPGAQAKADKSGAGQKLGDQLSLLQQQRYRLIVETVGAEVAAMLGLPDGQSVDPELAFSELGFNSQMTVELRNRLVAVTGLQLPDTIGWDYGSVSALARYLEAEPYSGSGPAATPAARAPIDEPVAVVGMACRFAGGVDSAQALWDLVTSGADVVGDFPVDRGWDLEGLFDPDPDAVGKTYARYGAFLPDAAGFDAEFFGISPQEATAMDPQQRLLLEVCWEAVETAGIDPTTLRGSDSGVFVGSWTQPYGAPDTDIEGYGLAGAASSVSSGRVAYVLGLQGPAITVDTACSSSLVATHLACQSLRNGESALALAGGVTVMTTPVPFIQIARTRGLAADGRCRPFAAAADGSGLGEGAAVLVLERLSDARRRNHPVLAVIAGSAVNHDGASNGMSAPNGLAQQRVIVQAVANAGIALDHVDVVEAHSTASRLGDPIEVSALIATYGGGRDRERPLWLGSVKSNIGHTQAAAGAAGMIKMISALNHGTLPPMLHVDNPSPHIDWSSGTVRLLTESVAWPVTDHPRTAAVSSCGVSGTNAHLILQQAPAELGAAVVDPGHTADRPPVRIWPVSARTPAALSGQAARLHQYLVDHPQVDLTDVANSLAVARTHHSCRAAIVEGCRSEDPRADLLDALQALTTDQPHPWLSRHHHLAHQASKTVFVFPGEGERYTAMGVGLYKHIPGFAHAFDECERALLGWTGWSVRDALNQVPSAPPLARVDVFQPVLFAITVAMAEALRYYGIEPDAVIGLAQGEIAAAYVAGVLPLDQAAKVVALRSKALTALSGNGAMVSVRLAATDLGPRLQRWDNRLAIAAINGPSHSIVSGDPAALGQFVAACNHDNIETWPIAVDYALHSRQVDQLRQHLLDELAELNPLPSRIPLYSSVESEVSSHPLDTTAMNAEYWYRNLREPVQFHASVAGLLAEGECTFVELSPHPVLAPALADALAEAVQRTQSAVIPTLHRDRPDLDSMGAVLANLHNHGQSPSWSTLYAQACIVTLPTYAFQHEPHWLSAPTPANLVDPAEAVLWKAVDEDAIDTVASVLGISDAESPVPLGSVMQALRKWRKGHAAAGDAEHVSRLAGLSAADQRAVLIESVCEHAATVLGSGATVDADAPDTSIDLGFDC